MFKRKNKKISRNKAIFICVVFCLIGVSLFLNINKVKADPYAGLSSMQQGIIIDAPALEAGQEKGWIQEKTEDLKKWLQTEFYEKTLKKAGSQAFYSALKSSLNTIAYDTATWLGSGGEGQKPLFITEGWGEYLANIGDNAAGTFLETLGRDGAVKFNLCEVDAGVMAKIGLGLIQYKKPSAPKCTFSKMKENWGEALKSDSFLTDFQDMFNPTSSDLGIALTLQTGLMASISLEEEIEKLKLEANKGWLDLRGIDGVQKSYPGFPEDKKEQANYLKWDNMAQYTGDAFIDALNIFLNQLALTLFNNLMGNLTSDKVSSPYDWGSLNYFDSSGYSGTKGLKDKLRVLMEPVFKIRGDYEILAELSSCPDPTKAGPTNCVIEEKFRQGIESKMTVGEAMDKGYLNKSGIFGFTSNGLEPEYNQGYPYRSMIILRKYRILPVGWEIAAQYIKDNVDITEGARNLEDMVNCFSKDDGYGSSSDHKDWCDGLVDPSWVLKAPLNFCKKEGYGPEILVEQISGEGEDSELSISRNDNYCGDEQSCIKENDNGACELFGYCTKERRKWNFDAESCEARNNTCQTFESQTGDTISYLENTLDYCSSSNVGCKAYCTDYDYEEGEWCAGANDNKIYFNNNKEECDDDDEGCHEFIRTNDDLNVNLLYNSNFEEELSISNLFSNSWDDFGVAFSTFYKGEKSLLLNTDLNATINIDALSYNRIGEMFTLSFYSKGCDPGATFGFESADNDLAIGTEWQFNQASYLYTTAGADINIKIDKVDSDADCLIDAIKLERGGFASAYSDYREAGLIYEKLVPSYLDCKVSSPPVECDNYAQTCTYAEVDCELYSSTTKDLEIPAKVIPTNYCEEECVGYNTYVESETVFNSSNIRYLIPNSAENCSSNYVECDEFTNLDEIGKGGEEKEYYTNLKQCALPSGDCAEYYTWEGSDESGYQLKVFSLEKDNAGDLKDISGGDVHCDGEEDYDPLANPLCLEYYDTTGTAQYRYKYNTVTCSENCHPYRRTEKNIEESILTKEDCDASGSAYGWDNGDSTCYFCKNNGAWNSNQGACVYMAIPGEGLSCSASSDGCREYVGNIGNNMENIAIFDFESQNIDEWSGVNSNIAASNVALSVGGYSLWIKDGEFKAEVLLGDLINNNSVYTLSFLAKRKEIASEQMKVRLANDSNQTASFMFFTEDGQQGNNIGISYEWEMYTYNINFNDSEFTFDDSVKLVFDGTGSFYIDSIVLTEIVDTYYLIKDSWITPDSCNEDIYGDPYPLYDLGCDEYKDSKNKVHYLHSFNSLCDENAVGCELMIDTNNYSDGSSGVWNDSDSDGLCGADEEDCISVGKDKFIFMVYDKDKLCSGSDKGCERLGEEYKYEDKTIFSDLYIKNNPDDYNQIICGISDLGCEEWTYGGISTYFKDPGDMVCEWRLAEGQTSGEAWYEKNVKRCDDGKSSGEVNGEIDATTYQDDSIILHEDNICQSNSDCSIVASSSACEDDNDCNLVDESYNKCIDEKCHYSCLGDTNDYPCTVSNEKTFGLGGVGNAIYQPNYEIIDNETYNWVGLCPVYESGCSELIDPISKFSTNIIFNPNFSIDVDSDSNPDGWTSKKQDIVLNPNTLYILAVNGDNTATVTISNNSLFELKNDNELGAAVNNISVISSGVKRKSKRFYVSSSLEVSADITVANYSTNTSVELKKAIVEYQIEENLDNTICNGTVNFEEGCVLFNKRERDGAKLKVSLWDADLTYIDAQGVSPEKGLETDRDSNILLKVSPNRVCGEWLACKSYIKDENDNNVCFGVGLCNSVEGNGVCNNFISSKKENLLYSSNVGKDEISNLSGYVKAGHDDNDFNADYYPLGAMEQTGEVANVPNGDFEYYGENNYPVGWFYADENWEESIFSVINNPVEAQTEGTGYARSGRSFLKLGSTYSATSELIDVEPNVDYILSTYISTLNLASGTAKIKIQKYDGTTAIDNPFDAPFIELKSGLDWSFKVGEFETSGSDTNGIKLILYADGVSPVGNFYFDAIKLRPALNSRENDWNTPQSCRLYPADDSLSCEYYEDSGIKKKGLLGYCLEYDRYPGNTDACLLWYPIDKVKGEGIEEGGGYTGKYPVYYCTAVKGAIAASNFFTYNGLSDCGDLSDCAGYIIKEIDHPYIGLVMADINIGIHFRENDDDGSWLEVFIGNDSNPKGSWCRLVTVRQGNTPGMDMAQGNIPITKIYNKEWTPPVSGHPECIDSMKAFKYVKVQGHGDDPPDFDHSGLTLDKVVDPSCIKLVQTVNSVGDNKYWKGRVYEGSDFEIGCNFDFLPNNICSYPSEYKPFGSISVISESLNIINNPYEWDGNVNLNDRQPLYYNFNSEVKENFSMGQLYTDSRLKNLFAKSYGTWNWDGTEKRYIFGTGGWTPPSTTCSTRPVYDDDDPEADYCAIPPVISNVVVNNINIVKSDFINLTFNSEVDSQQKPLVMYAVDWGDGATTTVSGVEMVDRRNESNPHSLYHLYNYWDLKAKAANGVTSIDCSGVSTCKVTPKIKIRDNWGWCNSGTTISDCDQWVEYKECSDGTVCNEDFDCTIGTCDDGVITVREK